MLGFEQGVACLAPFGLTVRIRHRDGGEETLRVGVLRVGEDLIAWAELDQLALLHHRDAAGQNLHDGEVV